MYINTIIYKENKLKVSYHHRSNISETESTETIQLKQIRMKQIQQIQIQHY